MKTKVFKARMKTPGDAGRFEAVFATLGVVDHDGDLTERGAFGRQSVVIEGWNHEQKLPVGKGSISERGDEAICKGAFFLDTTAGQEHYATVKALDDLTEWSYTFNIVASRPGQNGARRVLEKLDVWGVSPVTRGAGLGTRTLAIKTGKRSAHEMTDEDIRLELDLLAIEARLMERRQKGKAEIKSILDEIEAMRDELLESQIADLEAALAKQRPAKQTNYDRVRAAIVAQYGEDHSPAWIDAMARGYLDSLAQRIVRRQESQAGISPNYALAVEQVRRWASQPA